MDTTTTRLGKIAKAKYEKDCAEKLALEAEVNKKMNYIKHLESYCERIKELMIVANALLENGFEIGENDCFISDGVSHKFGFITTGGRICNNIQLIGVGRCGGGVCGDDLAVNENGMVSYNMWGTCEDWDDKFETFEKAFYEYVDNM